MNEDELRRALAAIAGDTTPPSSVAARVESVVGRRLRRRRVVASAAIAAFVLGAVGLLRAGQESNVRTVPAEPPAPDAGPTVVAATADGVVRVLDVATGKRVRTLVAGGATGGIGRSPDGATVYYGQEQEGCDAGTIHSVPTDGSQPPKEVTRGTRPVVSPDGTRLAYWTRQSGETGCDLSIVVRVLATGAEQRWTRPNGYFGGGYIRHLDWSPDGTRLAYGFQGVVLRRGDGELVGSGQGGVSILDTTRPGTLDDAVALRLPKLDSFFRSWRPTGQLVMVLEWTTVAVVDPVTGVDDPLFVLAEHPASVEFDAAGRSVLYVDGQGRVVVRDRDAKARSLGSGYLEAVW